PGQRERSVYLPKGAWKNVDTGETLDGGVWVTAPAPIDVMPVFQKQ
ncbi:MAG: alpha-glucosidase, partial [Firmicutes bacterium]|nr:alpha-glucosidase [Bacillota bacterium]